MIRVGVIGYGYWGPNLVRNFAETADAQVTMVSDLRGPRLDLVKRRYPSVELTTDPHALISDSRVDAVIIATPVSSHFDLAMEALRSGKHVLVEKPLTATSEEALRLIDEAERRRLVLMVDHTFVYTEAVRKIREMVAGGDLGQLYYYDSVRVNLGLFQRDVSVLWDLAVHDLSIMDHVLAANATAVSATGASHVSGAPENTAYLTVFFESTCLAHVHVSWLAPVKVRRTLIGGSKKMIVYDDLEPSEKIKIYDKGIELEGNSEKVYQGLIGYRTGDMYAPHLKVSEALQLEARHFVDCIERGAKPVTDGQAGLRVIQILEAATQSLADRGRPVELKPLAVTA
jgi:predicted dehydrogenase